MLNVRCGISVVGIERLQQSPYGANKKTKNLRDQQQLQQRSSEQPQRPLVENSSKHNMQSAQPQQQPPPPTPQMEYMTMPPIDYGMHFFKRI